MGASSAGKTTLLDVLASRVTMGTIYGHIFVNVREHHSKTFSWFASSRSNHCGDALADLGCTISFLCWFYPVGYNHNMEANHSISERTGLVWLICVTFYLWISTFGQLCIAAFDGAELGGTFVSFGYTFTLQFCGILTYPKGFWIWLHRVTPMTYFTQSLMAAGMGDTNVVCRSSEFVSFPAPIDETCGSYMSSYINSTGGYLSNPNAFNTTCSFCTQSSTNSFLKSIHVDFDLRWRNWESRSATFSSTYSSLSSSTGSRASPDREKFTSNLRRMLPRASPLILEALPSRTGTKSSKRCIINQNLGNFTIDIKQNFGFNQPLSNVPYSYHNH